MEDNGESVPLNKDVLTSGDRAALYYFGLTGSFAIRKDDMAVFMVDALGRIVLMPPESVKVLSKPRVSDAELDEMSEEDAINILLKQGDSEDVIVEYLHQRNTRATEK